jgi:hypothetical protein
MSSECQRLAFISNMQGFSRTQDLRIPRLLAASLFKIGICLFFQILGHVKLNEHS